MLNGSFAVPAGSFGIPVTIPWDRLLQNANLGFAVYFLEELKTTVT
jgi:hypothetical protein